jgi:hypothetical protein
LSPFDRLIRYYKLDQIADAMRVSEEGTAPLFFEHQLANLRADTMNVKREDSAVRQLPPDVSEDQFERALTAFRGVIGDEWVRSDLEELEKFRDPYPVKGEEHLLPHDQ